jgi:hypothetical protein
MGHVGADQANLSTLSGFASRSRPTRRPFAVSRIWLSIERQLDGIQKGSAT